MFTLSVFVCVCVCVCVYVCVCVNILLRDRNLGGGWDVKRQYESTQIQKVYNFEGIPMIT